MADGNRPASQAQLRRVADDPGGLDLVGAPEGFDALVLADMVRARGGLSVFVARDAGRLSAFVDAFQFFGKGIDVLGEVLPGVGVRISPCTVTVST